MRRLLLAALICLPALAEAQGHTAPPPVAEEHGRYATYLLLHLVGSESYAVTLGEGGLATMTVRSALSDRGSTRSSTTQFSMKRGFQPVRLEFKRDGAAAGDPPWLTEVGETRVFVREGDQSREGVKPQVAFVGLPTMPAALQMMMMRYWLAKGSPAALPILRASDTAPPVEIRRVGEDQVGLPGGAAHLTRYTVANLVYGRQVVWMDDRGRLAALMTFAGGLPVEQVLTDYQPAFDQLVHLGVQQEMADLADLGRQIRPEASGDFAIVGPRLIDGTGAPAMEHAAVVVHAGRIASVGPEGKVEIPKGAKVIHAEGQSLLPGLWEMHSHYSGVEFGPALLAAGITTARDCGGEFEFLTTVRRKIDQEHALGPRLLLAGLVDSGGPLGFGAVDVETPNEGRAIVDTYAAAGFEQIKVYTQIKPDVLMAIADEAHRRGLTVTGHVPAAVDAFGGVADGMDQINHLQFVSRPMRVEDRPGAAVDLRSERAQALIALLNDRQIVVDPTDGWGEMASHPRTVKADRFEPGLDGAPFTLASKLEALGGPIEEARWREQLAANGQVIKALYDAGIPIVAGSDTGLIGYGIDRELELYVQAGLPPMAAIQTATLNAARAMRLERESGSVEVGKRADLVLVEGDPLSNISDLRRVVKVVRQGEVYDSVALGKLVGFDRTKAGMPAR